MKLLHLIVASLLSLASLIIVSSPAHAAPPEFTCDGFPYQLLTNRLFRLDPVTLTYVAQGTTNSPSLNGAGFNIEDNYAYALNAAGVYRLGSDSTSELISTGIGGALSFVGTMDYSGNLYGLKRTNRRVLIKMDITASEASGTTVFTEETFTGVTPPSTGDFVYVEDGSDAYILLVRGNLLYWYDFQTMTTYTQAAIVPPGAPSFSFGASWSDLSGRIWGFHNGTGDIYELINPFSSTPEWVFVADLTPNGNNDGFSCSAVNFPALPPVAKDDEFQTGIETALTGNLIADNGNGVDSDPDGATLSVLWADPATTAPSNGVISGTLSDGSFTYTPNAGFYGTDTFTYLLSDGGQTDTADVTITIDADNSDLPNTYAEALHNVIANAYIGSGVTLDSSPNSNSSANALGDTDDGLSSNLEFILGLDQTLTINVTEPVAGAYYLQGWIDWNADEDFDDADENIVFDLLDTDVNGQLSFTVTVPATATTLDSFMRLRWSSQPALSATDIAPDGEVEDYEISILTDLNIQAEKSVDVWDPNNDGLYALPGNDVLYTLTLTNLGDVPADMDSVFLKDKIPDHVTFYNSDIDGPIAPELHPVIFTQIGTTGLTFTYATDVGYSTSSTEPDNMSECNDLPSSGYNASITYICFNPKGQFLGGNPDPQASFSFRARID